MSTRIKDTNKKTGVARRVKENGYTHVKADARKAKRRAEALGRQAKYDALSEPEQATRDAELRRIYEETGRRFKDSFITSHENQ